MNKPKISIIAAIAGQKRVLGKDGQLPWHIPGELKRFKEITMGHPIIMGRKTYESIGRVLPGRLNIIVTHDPNFRVEGGRVVVSLDEAIELAHAQNDQEIFVIGGGQIYSQVLPLADKLYLTVIDREVEGDVFFPDYSSFTKVVAEQSGESDEFKYKFLELER